MTTEAPALAALLTDLRDEGLVEADAPERAAAMLATAEAEDDTPSYVRFLVGAGAWVSGLFFLGFVFGIVRELHLDDQPELFCFLGVAAVFLAARVRRGTSGTFAGQLCLASSMAGHVLATATAMDLAGWHRAAVVIPLMLSLLAVLVYPRNPDPVHRFGSPFAALFAWTVWFLSENLPWAVGPLVVVETAAAALLLAHPRARGSLRPLAFAVATASLLTAALSVGGRLQIPWELARLGLGCGLLALMSWCADGRSLLKGPLLAAAVAVVLLAVIAPPGLLVALAYMVLGRALSDTSLTWLGTVFVPPFLSVLYYDLNVSLAWKSWVLAGSGLVILLLRAHLARLVARSRPAPEVRP